MDFFKSLEHYYKEQEWPAPYNNDNIPDTYGISLLEGQTMYALVRLFKPVILIETGTNMGNALWFIAKAVERNRNIDLVDSTIATIDIEDYTVHRAQEFDFIKTFKSEAIEWMRGNESVLQACDFFSHDDNHMPMHIMDELSLIAPHRPKVITIHDAQTESKDFWNWVLSDKTFMPNYSRYTLESLMGIGIMIRQD